MGEVIQFPTKNKVGKVLLYPINRGYPLPQEDMTERIERIKESLKRIDELMKKIKEAHFYD